ncbi:RecQ-mediated genome instability protein 1 [Entamoeba marina]
MSDEQCLPKTSVNKLIKENLSASIRVSSDFREVIADCGVEFIHLIATQAKDVAASSNRKTLNTDHVIQALKDLGLGCYVDELHALIADQQKEVQKKPVETEKTHEERLKIQKETERKAAESLRKKYGDGMVNTLLGSLDMSNCLSDLQRSNPQAFDNTSNVVNHVYSMFLMNDIRITSNPVLGNYTFSSNADLRTVVLQVDEYSDISVPMDDQYKESKNRMIKMKLTDGTTTLYGVEMSRIDGLCMGMKPGIKLVIKGAKIRRGYACLTNANVQVLGGEVEWLCKLEIEKRSLLEKKYRPSYIPSNVKREVAAPQVGESEEEE